MPSFALATESDYEPLKKLWFETWLKKSLFVHIRHAQTHALMRLFIRELSNSIVLLHYMH